MTPIKAGFPSDHYTPFGYLATPDHTWRLNRIGVVRVEGAIRCSWYFPSYPGPYGRDWLWQVTLEIELGTGERADEAWEVDVHTSQRFQFHRGATGVDLFVTNASIVARIQSQPENPIKAMATYRRQLGRSGDWDFGLYARQISPRSSTLGVYAEGTVFCLATDATGPTWTIPPPDESWPDRSVPIEKTVSFRDAHANGGLAWVILAHGESDVLASAEGVAAQAEGEANFQRRSRQDDEFWRDAPRLDGDWPDHWRHGFVYDLETVRSVIRTPRGQFASPWDGMQIQVPRFVLAEAAIDMAVLSLADPSTAREVIEGIFCGPLAPNLPCIREDGSTNMVTSDGRARGTGPNWGWPLWCVEHIHCRAPDRDWLARILPGIERYLDWWFTEQVASDGHPYFSSGWESGQDGSARFNAEAGGGHIESIEPVDLVASLAAGADQIVLWCRRLELPTGVWPRRRDEMRRRLKALGAGDWFFDTRNDISTGIRDPMHLSVALAVDLDEPTRSALARNLRSLPGHAGYSALEWPPVALTVLESAVSLRESGWAGDAAYDLVDRVWRTIDAPTYDGTRPLPGIAHEHWPESGEWHTEGYGWGAATAFIFTRYIAGLRFDAETGALSVSPALPSALRRPGAAYHIRNLRLGNRSVDVTYAIGADGAAVVTIDEIDEGSE